MPAAGVHVELEAVTTGGASLIIHSGLTGAPG